MQNDNIQTSFPPFKPLSKGGNAKSDGLEVDSSRPPLHDGPKQARGDDTVFLSGNGIFCDGTCTVPEEFSLGRPGDALMQRIKPYLEGCPIAVCFLLIRKP